MTKDEAIQRIVEDCLTILHNKGNDYQDDITPLGMRGCFANLFRKVMRLKSLIWDEREAAVEDETLEDTILDLINYGIITELLRRGEWTLPWEDPEVDEILKSRRSDTWTLTFPQGISPMKFWDVPGPCEYEPR